MAMIQYKTQCTFTSHHGRSHWRAPIVSKNEKSESVNVKYVKSVMIPHRFSLGASVRCARSESGAPYLKTF